MPDRKQQYVQVFLTYYRRPAFRILVLSAFMTIALFFAFVSARAGGFDPYHFSAVGQILMFVAFLVVLSPLVWLITFTATLMWHLREQLTSPIAELIPGFRKANLNVAGAIFLCVPLVAGIVCWGIDQLMLMRQLHHAVYTGVQYEMHLHVMQGDTTFALGVFAVALTLMSLTALWASFRSPWMSLLIIPLFLFAITWQPVATFIDHLLSPAFSGEGSNRLHALEMIAVNAVLLAAVRMKLSQQRHEQPVKRFGPTISRNIREDTPPPPPRLLTAPFTRIWHRRHGVLNPLAPWAVAGIIGLLLVCVPLVLGAKQADMLRSLLLPTLVPGVVISALWRERWLNLGYESLYPVERSRFIGELAAATAISVAELWLTTTLAVLPAIAIWQPRMLTSQMLYVTIAASAAMQFMVFGVMFVTALFRPLLPYMNIVTILAMLVPIALTWASEPALSPHGLLVVASIEMAVGLILTTWGSSAWRRADLA
jgi:hypothetical protein